MKIFFFELIQNKILFKLGVAMITTLLVVVFMQVEIHIPFCPSEHIVPIATELNCSCFLWHVFLSEGLALLALMILFGWENIQNRSSPMSAYLYLVLFFMFGAENILEAITGLVGAVGPDTILANSIYEIGIVLLFNNIVYLYFLWFYWNRYKRLSMHDWLFWFIASVLAYFVFMAQIIEKI